jgi:salicylate hydroxylase
LVFFISKYLPNPKMRVAPLKLRFIVVGGGIAGLACAYTLQIAGHRVHVVEQSDGKHRVSPLSSVERSIKTTSVQSGNGVRCPPNMNRYLKEWGLGAAIDRLAIKTSAINCRDGFGMSYSRVISVAFNIC